MAFCRFVLTALVMLSSVAPPVAQDRLNDLEMAHVAVTASNIDIAYAHIALAFSDDPAVRKFAETMIRDHSAVNGQVMTLAKKLDVTPQDNAMSQQLLQDSKTIKDELVRLRGAAFDTYYAKNELAYHRAVNSLVADTFLPSIMNTEMKNAFAGALTIFRGHEQHAEQMVGRLTMATGRK